VKHSVSGGVLTLFLFLVAVCVLPARALDEAPGKIAAEKIDELKFVVIVSRHGVRSPTGKLDQLNQYSRQPWPVWSVPPCYLTEHGAHLMTLFGAYDRQQMASQGLLTPSGCADAAHIRIVADSDQRTRETGKALAAGLAPGCAIEVRALPEGTPDPLFHSLEAGVGHPAGLTEAYRAQLEMLEDVLRGCAAGVACPGQAPSKSIFDIPSSIALGKGGHLVDLRTPLGTAATMSEDLLLEYAEGMDASNVGWGRVDIHKLRDLLQLHTANVDIAQRTNYVARAQASNMLVHILQSMEQASSARPVAGALTQPGDRLLILAGHDTNIAAIAGSLNLSWLIDGRRDDTPPGGALVFELWKRRGAEEYSVHTFYEAQTLDQMRNATPLSLANPPERVLVFVPSCSRADGSCSWETFKQAVQMAIQ